ncbi:hypothetical protein GCM10028801_19510 [Nocardioides maradonensis]
MLDASVRNLGRGPTAVLVYLLGAAAVMLVGWPAGLLAHAVQGAVDEPAFRWFDERRLGWWSHIWLRLTQIGSPTITQEVTAVAAVGFAVVWAVQRRSWWFPLLALPLGYCLEKYTQILLQTVVHRGHPPTTLGTFPSGGCGRVLVIYGMVVFLTVSWLWPHSRRMWVAGWSLVACLVSIQAYARIYNLEHWLTDVLGGILFGTVLLVVMSSCLRILDLPQSERRAASSARRHVGVRPRSELSRSSYGA